MIKGGVGVVALTIIYLFNFTAGLYVPGFGDSNQNQPLIWTQGDEENLLIAKPPYLHSVDQYFKQSTTEVDIEESEEDDDDDDNDDFSTEDINHISLKNPYTWHKVLQDIRDLNKKSKSKKSYKLFFLQRHGEGWHNYAMDQSYYNASEWKCYWQLQAGNEDIEWEDAMLTPRGIKQVKDLTNQFTRENIPMPQSFYVSPLRRTLKTWEYMWGGKTDVKPIVKEFARESYGIGTESKRHSQSYIEDMFPFVEFEHNFSSEDELWDSDVHESKQHRNWRAQMLLIDIFQQLRQHEEEHNHERKDVVSIVSHSGLISSILKVIGHKKWKLPTGSMIPVVIGIDWDKFGKVYKLSKPWKTMDDYCPK